VEGAGVARGARRHRGAAGAVIGGNTRGVAAYDRDQKLSLMIQTGVILAFPVQSLLPCPVRPSAATSPGLAIASCRRWQASLRATVR